MDSIVEINYLDIKENKGYEKIVEKVLKVCFEVESLINKKLYVEVILTNPENIRKINKEHRNIDKGTDVLSFPMFEKEELVNLSLEHLEVLGDIVVSIEKVKEQAEEYGHSFERELAYMLVHGFYHLLGYDHMEENDKKIMREKEESVLTKLNIIR